jgi:hypothetical protein
MWVVEAIIWHLTKCLGCEKINLKISVKHLGNEDPLEQLKKNTSVSEFYFPKKYIRKPPDWIARLPIKYVELFGETYSAINNNLFRLSLMGSRTIIETFILDKIGDIGTFKQKLDKLEADGFIAKNNKEILYAALDAGNAAAHRGFKPDDELLNHVMDIIENLVQTIILNRTIDKLKSSIPQRTKN